MVEVGEQQTATNRSIGYYSERIENMNSDEESDALEAQGSLIIPVVSGSDDSRFIEIFPDEMRDIPVTTLMKVLQDEKSDKGVWADASLYYMQRKLARESLTLLQQACELDSSITVGNNEASKVRILAATGIAHVAVEQAGGVGALNNNKQRQTEKEEIRQLADQKFTQAGKIDTFFPMTWIGRGMLYLTMEEKERQEQAKFFFQTTLKQCGPVIPALLGMGAVLYNEGDFKGAQEKYAEAIRLYPVKSGASTRVGFGLACYKLGQVDRAKAAFARALALDPENVQAMVGSAILEMASLDETQKDFSSRTEKAIKMMSMANLLDHSNAMVQNHLANHYFWKWTPLTGIVSVTQGTSVVKSSQVIPLEAGEQIRIGTKFEAVVKDDTTLEDIDDEYYYYRINKVWKDESVDGLKVWKKDYERVIDLAKGAYCSTAVQEIQAESLFFLARVYHVREDIDNAQKCYEKACKLAPTLSPARFGLAQTLIVQENYSEAAVHLKQLVATSVNATDALALLGLLEVRSGSKMGEEGLAHLRKAIELDPLNPDLVILEAMALQQHKSGYPKSLEKYKKAVELLNRKSMPVPYSVYNNIGVLCHETKKYEEALEMFKLALISLNDADDVIRSPRLVDVDALELCIQRAENEMFFTFEESIVRCELIVKDDAMKIRISDTKDRDSLPFSEKSTIRLGETLVVKVKGIELVDDELVAEIYEVDLNTMYSSDKKTITYEEKVYSIFVMRENTILEVQEAVTIAFNIARLHESTGKTLAAIEIHKAIVKRNPAYVNSYLRLACISVDCGCLNECAEWLKIAAVSAPGNSEVLTLIGNLHLSLCDWKPAQKVFDGLMSKKIPSVEAYSSLSMGNIYFATLHVNEDRYTKHLQYAADFYKRILTKDSLNAYAANGLGTVLAEKGEIFKAKEAFNRVREVSGDSISDALLNLGHIYLAQKKHPEALQMYKSYLKKAEDGTNPISSKSRREDIVDVLLYISFAYFDWARHTELFNDANAAPADERYKFAMEHLNTAISKRSRKEVILKYNLCMTKLQAANCVLQKLTRNIPRTVEEVEIALRGLEDSLVVVEKMLDDKEKGEKVNIRTSVLEDFLKHCRANITSAQSHLEDEKKRAEEEKAEADIRRLAAEATATEAALREAIKSEAEAKLQEERDKRAEAKMRKVEELKAGWSNEQDATQNDKDKKAKKRNREDMQADLVVEPDEKRGRQSLFDDSEESDGDEEVTDSAKVNQKDLFGDSSDEEGDKKSTSKSTSKDKTKNAESLFGDSDDDDDDDKATTTVKVEERKEVASSKDIFGDSDDESDEELVSKEK